MNFGVIFVFVLLFIGVMIIGFLVVNWWCGDFVYFDEWGFGGCCFGMIVMWFLFGGDFYMVYMFVVVFVFVFGVGVMGFFVLLYMILIYLFVFVVFLKLWSIVKWYGYVMVVDFVNVCYGSWMLVFVIVVMGIVVMMLYIVL